MKNKPKIAVLGGDMRQYAVAKELSKSDVNIYTYGLQITDEYGIKLCDEPFEAIESARAVILPLPAGVDGNLLNCPALKSTDRISLDSIVDSMDEKSCLLGGRITQSIVIKAQGRGIKVIDYFLSERLQIKNAYITAEAAVSIAMNSLNKCILESRIGITGTGRIARFLAEIFIHLGARVTVAGRNADALAYFEILGCKTVRITQADDISWSNEFISGYDIMLNTVPSWLFGRDFLSAVDENMLIIELASAPGGIDICAARELSSNVLWGSSLPGKYAPYSAGALIAECIIESFREVGII